MGANNWGECPQCRRDAAAKQQRRAKVVGEAYGQVSSEEYQTLFKRASEPISLSQTLREDYEIRTTANGRFMVDYGASCRECGFSFEFRHEVDNVLTAPPPTT
jgi:hypothetical protein